MAVPMEAAHPPLRSAAWFAPEDIGGLLHRASLSATGLSRAHFQGRPIVGICNSASDLVSCNLHFGGLVEAVKRGVLQAGGVPIAFPALSLGENLMKPTAMMYRNLMSMDVEESIRAYPFDAVVLLGGCDKSIPAGLMGALSANVPTIMLPGGPANPGVYKGRELGIGTDLWKYVNEYRAGNMAIEEIAELEASLIGSVGHCPELGTASTMSVMAEALGMSLPGTATIQATDSRRYAAAEQTGSRSVALAREGLKPSQILDRRAFTNAIITLMAIGGSTNAILHLIALAGRSSTPITLEDFDRISRTTPVIASIRPSGTHLFKDLDRIGGVPALMKNLIPLLDSDAMTITGATVEENLREVQPDFGAHDDEPIMAPLSKPFSPEGGIAVVRGNLAPDGAVIKTSAASTHLLNHRGKAVVFDGIDDLHARINDPELDVDENSVLVLRCVGPLGAPGMPEWGQLPIPEKLLKQGVRDMVRISDARMSGTAFGTVVLHVSPEAAAGGPLGLVHTGDLIELDVTARKLELLLDDAELQSRTSALPGRSPARGYLRLFQEHVLQADHGCDFDFLVGPPDEQKTLPTGIIGGWHGGW